MDRIEQAVRSKVMSSVRSKGTRLELRLIQALKDARLGRFHTNVLHMIGRPDIVFEKARVAVFVDSCFWHGCRWHCRMPIANAGYWQAKIDRNRIRDRQVSRQLRKQGWCVIRIWEHTLKTEAGLAHAITRIGDALKQTSK